MPRSLRALALILVLSLGGCGAPNYNLFGAFFPAWMLCALLGIACALAARTAFVATGLSNELPHQLALCSAVGAIFAIIVWLLFFEL